MDRIEAAIDKIPSSREELLALARADYAAPLVEIDLPAIGQVTWPLDPLQPMVIHLRGAVGDTRQGALSFFLLMDSINYRFWRIVDGKQERYSRHGKSGARALWAAFEAAWGREEATAAGFRHRLRETGVEGLFGDIPDAASRAAILDEILSGEMEAVCRDLVQTIDDRHAITVADASQIACSFPVAFADRYLKKAQLTLSMYGAYLRGRGATIDTSDLTAFADYQVPRVLRALGILRYGAGLGEKIDAGLLLLKESAEERAIRAASILACEHIAAECHASPADVDNLLWQSKDIAGQSRFHLAETTWY